MIVVNFSHPLTSDQVARVESLTGQKVERVIEVQVQFDHGKPFGPQVVELVNRVDLSPTEWQIIPILIVPPALNFIAVLLLAELHGRMGYFPPCLRLRPVEGSLPPRYEVAEVLDLQAQRDAARARRAS
ncbi:MAG TPA: hypothetical protein EYP52_00235 [Anaerolineae bacterium]|nr:hypothetical protein [Anaerolineae bacterium]